MSERIELTASPASLRMYRGDTAESGITLRNLGTTVDQFTISLEGLDPKWYKLPVSSVALFPNDQDIVKVIVNLPEDVDPGVDAYPITVRAISQENPTDITTTQLNIEVGKAPKLELNISPERLSGRKGTYTLAVSNPDRREYQTQLHAGRSRGGLIFKLQPDSFTVPAGGKAEAALNVRLNWLSLILGRETFDFEVTAKQPSGASVGVVSQNGQLVNTPWYRFFSRLRLPFLSKPPVIKTFEAKTDNKREYQLNWLVQRSSRVTLDGSDVETRGETEVHPTEPSKYVLTATNRYGSSTRTIEVKPLPVPQARASDKIKVSMSPVKMQTQAGLVPAQANIQIQNLSTVVDKFMVEVEGLDESWYTRSASSIALMPQASDQVQISFLPPKKKGVKSGTYPFSVIVHSQSMAQESASIIGQMEILPSTEFKLKVHPYRLSGMRKGTCNLNIANTGVSEINIAITATDLDEGLKYQFKPDNLTLGAWNTVELPIVFRPRRGSFLGAVKRYDITITASPENGNPQPANCEFTHSPFLKSWKPIFRLIRIIIGLAFIVAIVVVVIRWGGGWNVLRASPQTWFTNIVNSIQGWFH